ncbi:MAG TPA: Stf0 family sulfotransferase [Pyrinomonadaceae bacterium]|jgi:LPS sulfotransferase NodH
MEQGSSDGTPVRGSTRARRFVIVAAPRTGSNWVCSMLNSHPEILCHHEIFNPEGIHYALDHRAGDMDVGTVAERDAAPLDFIARLWRQDFGKRLVGFKINRGQNEAAFRHVLADKGVSKIVLVRRNRVKTFVSEMIAEKTGQWESYGRADGARPVGQLDVDAQALRRHVAVNRDYYARVRDALQSSGQQYLQVTYENLKGEAEWRDILRFLGVAVTAHALKPATRKQNPGHLRDLISNYEQLEAALVGSELEAELRDPES